MNLTLLKNFNNYFNRKIIKFDSYDEYISSYAYKTFPNINFNPNDGVGTEQILNWEEDWTPDYLICFEKVGSGTDAVPEIKSRWFVVEAERTRGKQYKVTLRRDVIADNFDLVLNSTCFVEKGNLMPDNPLLFNKESMTFNQIKKDEFPLKDKSGCAWIVGYIARNYLSESGSTAKEISGKYNVNYSAAINVDELPWNFVSTPSIIGVTSGYQMKLNIGVGIDYFSYGQYSRSTPLSAQAVLNYDKYGSLISTSGSDSWTAISGSVVNYSSSSPEYNNYQIMGINSYGHGKDIGTYLSNHKTLDLANVPQEILDEQQNAQVGAAELLTYNNKIVKVEVQGEATRYYRLNVETVTNPTFDYDSTDYNILSTNVGDFITAWNADHQGAFKERYALGNKPIILSATFDGVRITPELISQEEVSVEIPVYSHRIHLNDGPYDMFCMPYGELKLKTADIISNKDAALGLSFYIASELGSSVIYDLQLLPYCPVQNFLSDEGELTEYGTEGYEYCYIRDTQENIKSIMIWCMDSSNTFNINKTIEIDRPHQTVNINQEGNCVGATRKYSLKRSGTKWIATFQARLVSPYTDSVLETVSEIYVTDGTNTDSAAIGTFSKYAGAIPGIYNISYEIENPTVISNEVRYNFHFTAYREREDYINLLEVDTKVSNECDLYRIVSPNFSGQFELSIAKNGGSITSFNVDYTYKPYAPYIHINPEFKGLYGQDWNDSRGLICGGDFSLPLVTDAWTDFQVQNKNYQNIFDREIQNMDVNNSINKQEAAFQAVAGTFSGAASGAVTGALSGGGAIGAVVGGVVGGVASGIGGMVDYSNLVKRQEEAKDFKIDMYGYQLGNIQALPYSLSKTSAFTYNNKIFPIVEYYTCTEEEKEALRNKIKYDGMTVMAITTLAQVTTQGELNYVKGRLIRLDTLIEDSHLAYTIYEEINKGVYI